MREPSFIRQTWRRGAWAAAIGALLLSWFPVLAREFPLPPRGDEIARPATSPLAGSWIGEARAPDVTYKILLFHTVGAHRFDGTEDRKLNCVILEPAGLESASCSSYGGIEGDATSIKATMMGEYGQSQKGLISASSAFGELSLSLGGDGKLSGTWHEAEVSFTRRVPRIELAEAAPVKGEDLDYLWAHFRKNGGSWTYNVSIAPLEVVLSGADLPYPGYSAGEIVVDDPHFELYRAAVADDGKLHVRYLLHEGVRPGRKRITLAGGASAEFELVIDRKPCTLIAVVADKPKLPFDEYGLIEWHFLPENCAPPPNDKTYVSFGSSDRAVVETLKPDAFDQWRRVPHPPSAADLAGRSSYRATGAGTADLTVSYGGISGAAAIVVEDRVPCTGLAIIARQTVIPVGGQAELTMPAPIGRVESTSSAMLLPAGCALKAAAELKTSVEPEGVVNLAASSRSRSTFGARGLKAGRATVTAELGDLKATVDIHVTAPPACDRVDFHLRGPIAVGEVAGVAYRGGPYLSYSYGDPNVGPDAGNAFTCKKPEGEPYFQASNRHIDVDRATGAVTGISAGRAKVAAFHGDLMDVAEVEVTDTPDKPCTGIDSLSFPIDLALGARTKFDARYSPLLCNPPPGRPDFSVEPIGPVAVTPDGIVAAQGPGSATITMRHGSLTTTRQVAVAELKPCMTIHGAFEPGIISALAPVSLRISYGPLPCAPPQGEVAVLVNADHFRPPMQDGGARTLELSDHLKRIELGVGIGKSAGVTDDVSTLGVQLRHGALQANLLLPWDNSRGCRFGQIKLSADRLAVGETARLDIEKNFPECLPDRHLVREYNGFTQIAASDGHYVVKAIRAGSPWIVGPMNSVPLVIDGPPCTGMTLSYPKVMKRRDRAVPELAYAPEGCMRPENAWPVYVSDAPKTIGVEDGHPRGTIRARHLDPSNPGVAKITVTHGDLSASTSVAIEGD